jgi:site-specific recombinase XerD
MYEMMNLHYYLEKRNDKEGRALSRECPVIVSFSYSSYRVKTYTGRKILEQEWDKSTERVKPIYLKAIEFNDYLDLLNERVHGYFKETHGIGRIPDPTRFQKELKKMAKSEVPSFFNLIIRFMEENSVKWSISTYKKMKTFYAQLKEFSEGKNESIQPGMINQQFADRLVKFYRDKGLKDTSIKKNLDLLKWFLNWGVRNGLIFNRDFEHIRFSPDKSVGNHNYTFLKWDELTGFYNFSDLTKKEEWSRDIFCFISFTGIRFAKMGRLTKGSMNGRYIQTDEERSRKYFLNRFSTEICRKYENKYYRNNSLFPVVSLITFHKHLRSAAFKAGLNRTLFTDAGLYTPDVLHKLISAQTAINTFYASAVRLDIPGGLNSMSNVNSTKARIFELSGAQKFSEDKQISTSDQLYETIRGSGQCP